MYQLTCIMLMKHPAAVSHATDHVRSNYSENKQSSLRRRARSLNQKLHFGFWKALPYTTHEPIFPLAQISRKLLLLLLFLTITGRAGPEGSRKLRLSDFMTTARYGGRLSALRTGRLYPQEHSWYSFSLRAESTPRPWFGRKEICHWNIQWHHRESIPGPSD